MRKVHCVVVGAGPAGLASAALLREQGREVLVLERARQLAPKWRAGYDRLRLNTSSWFSHLPGQRFPREHGRWLTRDQVVAYYDDFVRRRGLEVETGVDAHRVSRAHGGWAVETSSGTFAASRIVVATGKHDTAVIPPWPGREAFAGELLHAAEYRNAAPYRGRRALVVGAGNSAMDIALDLAEGGAAGVCVSLRRPPHLMPREVFGLPHDLFGVAARRAPRRLVDANAKLLRRVVIGDLADVGLPLPADGTISRFERDGRVPTIDTGAFSEALRARRITVVCGVAELDGDAVVLDDASRVKADVVVAATGYRSELEGLVGHLGVLDDTGLPAFHAARTHPAAPGLHFVGFLDPRSGQLRELRLQARALARATRR